MNLQEYKVLAEKTLSSEFHSDSQMEKILHASLGLATEIEELLINYSGINKFDPTNLLEEVGDLTWYLSIFYREYPELEVYQKNNPLAYTMELKDPFKLVLSMLKGILQVQDLVKKKLFYNKEIKMEVLFPLVQILDLNIKLYLGCYYLNIEDVWEKNIAKLKIRYGDKFTSERAINRDLETERTILEGK